MDVVRRSFRPEFLNRLDEIILFNRLGRNEMKRIVDIQLKHLQRLLDDRKIALQIDETAKAWLGEYRLRPGLWRAPAQARHSAGIAESTGQPVAGRGDQGWRDRAGLGAGWSARHQRRQIGRGGLGRDGDCHRPVHGSGRNADIQRGDDVAQQRGRSRRNGSGGCRNARGRECVPA